MIDEMYVKTGQVRVVVKSFPVHGAAAELAAQAALCAAEQGKLWEYNDRLMERYYMGDPVASSAEGLKQVAADLGLDTAAFSASLDGGKYARQVQDEVAEAQALGVTAAPTFFVNDTKIVGAQPFETFQAAIDAALAGE